MPTVALALGSNLPSRHGDPAANVQMAAHLLGQLPHTQGLKISSIYRVPALLSAGDATPQPDYANAVVLVRTVLAPQTLLQHTQALERDFGRVNHAGTRWQPRTLDVDILLYDSITLDEVQLHIPHPRLHERHFMLQPLCEVWPDATIPQRGRAVDCLHALAVEALPVWKV